VTSSAAAVSMPTPNTAQLRRGLGHQRGEQRVDAGFTDCPKQPGQPKQQTCCAA
jgi:hypothetical protein